MRALAVGLLGAGALLLAAPAHGNALVRAARRGPGIASATWVCDAGGIDYAEDGVHFREVAFPEGEPVDMAVLDDGTLLVATKNDSADDTTWIWVTRVASGRKRGVNRRVARVPLYSWVELRVDDTGVKLVTDKATHLSTDGGRTFAPIPGAGGFEPGPGLPDGTPPRYPWRRDNYYTVSRAEDGCTLELHAGRTTTVVDRGGSELECTLSGADNGRFVILLFGNRLLRVGARGTERLGVVPVIPKDFTPDFRGRAIVLDDESGKLTRYARCAPPVVLLGDPK